MRRNLTGIKVLQNSQQLVSSTAMAMGTLSCGRIDKAENEKNHGLGYFPERIQYDGESAFEMVAFADKYTRKKDEGGGCVRKKKDEEGACSVNGSV